MSASKQNRMENGNMEIQWKGIYILGGITTIIALAGIVLDVIAGNALGGNLSTLPQTAVGRFAEFQKSPLTGLYHLDLLNVLNQLILIPAYFALYAAHRKSGSACALLALIIFLVGTTTFVTTNTALPMLELSKKYAATTAESQKTLLAAAGEAMLARGAHGSPGVLIGFLLPTIAGVVMSFAMLTGRVFNKSTSILGIVGNTLMLFYLVLVTAAPVVKDQALAFSMPAGLLLMAWMVMYTIRLFQLGRAKQG